MTRLGMGIKASVAITIMTLLLVGCGNTGPDVAVTPSVGDSSSNANTDGGAAASAQHSSVQNSSVQNSSVQNSSVQNSSVANEFSATMPDSELLEGSYPLVNNTPQPDGSYSRLKISIQLNKKLSQVTKLYLMVDQNRSTCPTGITQRLIAPDFPVELAAGEDKVNFTLEAYPDSDVEANCENSFTLKMVDAIDERTIPVEGKVTLIDDDVPRNFAVSAEYGSHGKVSLMGSKEFDGRTFQVEQLGQRQARFTIEDEYLHYLVPGTPDLNVLPYDNSGIENFVFRITPSNGDPSFTVSFPARRNLYDVIDNFSRGGGAYTEEGDDNEADFEYAQQHYLITDIVLNGFWDNYFYSDLSKISWTLKTILPTNEVKLGVNGVGNLSSLIDPYDLKQEEIDFINKAKPFILDSDNRTLRINPVIFPILESYISDMRIGELKPDIEVCESASSTSRCQTQQPSLLMRSTAKTISLNLSGIESRLFIEKDRFYIVVKDVTSDALNHVTRLIPLSAPETKLTYFHSGQYELKLVDYKGDYRASTMITLYPDDKDKSVSLAVEEVAALSNAER